MKAVSSRFGLKLQVVVTGSHLLKEKGETGRFVEKDFPIASYVKMYAAQASYMATAQALGRGIVNFSTCYYKLKPHIVVVAGDRIEALAATEAAAVMNIPVAHIHAGDVSLGNVDESIRFVITRFAHILFAATANSAKRLLASGEEKRRVFNVGAPQIDAIRTMRLMGKKDTLGKFKIKEPYVLLLHNPVTASLKESVESIRSILKVLDALRMATLIIYPNSDPGSREMIEVIEKYKNRNFFKFYRSLSGADYFSLLKHSKFVIGNTTSGIIEAPFFHKPFINIGTRQSGRDAAKNVVWLESWKPETIKKAIEKVLKNAYEFNFTSPYGNGDASKKIAEVLAEIRLGEKLLMKSYHSLLD
jgi:UDP-N-acetylglucosamine 2-epimerase (non-hydrolysing)/GDP/UDP-N,N'-diacetylbacillosamine 2-epimerase (hydrolysing)